MAKKSKRDISKKGKAAHLLDKKHRPIHGMIVGVLLVLLRSVSFALSVIGIILLIVSVLMFLIKLKKAKA